MKLAVSFLSHYFRPIMFYNDFIDEKFGSFLDVQVHNKLATGALVATSRFDNLILLRGNDENDFLLDYLTFFRRLIRICD